MAEDIFDPEQQVSFEGGAFIEPVCVEVLDGGEDDLLELLPFFVGQGIAGGGDDFGKFQEGAQDIGRIELQFFGETG